MGWLDPEAKLGSSLENPTGFPFQEISSHGCLSLAEANSVSKVWRKHIAYLY